MTSLRSGVKLKEMIKCIKHRLINIFSFSDTAGRLDYLCVYLGSWGFFLIPLYITILLDVGGSGIAQFLPLILIILAIIGLANTCRRLNDLKKTRLLVLLLFVPIIGLIFILYLLFTPGTKYIKKNK